MRNSSAIISLLLLILYSTSSNLFLPALLLFPSSPTSPILVA